MFEKFCPKIFCFRHLLAITTGLVLLFKDCICYFRFITICYPGASSVRRILKRGGQKFQKIWEEQRSESEVVPFKFSLIFRPNLGEEQKKKRSSLKFCPIFRPNLGEEQKKKKKKGLYSRSVPFFTRTHSNF